MTARPLSSECKTSGSRVPAGASSCVNRQDCTGVHLTGPPIDSNAPMALAVDRYEPGYRIRPYTPDVLLGGDETLELAGIEFQTLRVPGHSPAHLGYYADGCLFSGDVLFAGSVGRTDLPGGDWDTLVESIRMVVDRFPPETLVYPGHGAATTLGAERDRNPFLAELRA